VATSCSRFDLKSQNRDPGQDRAAIDRLGYVRNEQAYELRNGARTSGRKRRGTGEPRTAEDDVREEFPGPAPQRFQVHGSWTPLQLLEGSHVGLVSRGNELCCCVRSRAKR
jgi:hypothetical protein